MIYMKQILTYEEYINEKINWDKVKKYGQYALLSLLIGYNVSPDNIKKYPIKKYIEYKLDNLENHFIPKEALNDVIHKVKNSEDIENKEEVINRLKNVKVKKYDNSISYFDKETLMFYFYSEIGDEDYIVVLDEYDPSLSKIIHELNHLVDKHRINKNEISIDNIFNKNANLDDFLNFYKDFPKISRDTTEMLLRKSDIEFKRFRGDKINIGYLMYYNYMSNKDYYTSDSELYARVSSMKSFLRRKGYLENGKITKSSVDNFIEKYIEVFRDRPGTYNKIYFLTEFDFFIIAPLINWDKLEEIDLIASDNTTINNLT
jgi:hypothetical protein